jgi:outer membrane murein-binding lipoprotein Lpp
MSNGPKEPWHIGREVSLPGLVALLAQTAAFVWWLGSLSATVTGLVSANAKLEAEVKALSTNVTVPTALSAARIETLNSRMSTLENQLCDVSTELNAVRNEQARRTPFIPQKRQ